MLKKFKVLIVIASLAITLSLMSNTYSRYVASSEGNVEIEFAKWQMLVNNTDITNETSSNISFEPVINKSTHVANNKIAPSSTGHFDIEIDPTNVDVSFKYTVELGFENNLKDNDGNTLNIDDLIITDYAILPKDYIEGQGLTKILVDSTNPIIENTMNYITGGFNKFTIRVFFKWFEGKTDTMNETMDDTADTAIGLAAANYTNTNVDTEIENNVEEVELEETTDENADTNLEENTDDNITKDAAFKINANISFEQIIG